MLFLSLVCLCVCVYAFCLRLCLCVCFLSPIVSVCTCVIQFALINTLALWCACVFTGLVQVGQHCWLRERPVCRVCQKVTLLILFLVHNALFHPSPPLHHPPPPSLTPPPPSAPLPTCTCYLLLFILPPSDTWCFVVRHLISVVPAEPMSYTHVGTCTNPAHTHMHTLILGCCAHTQLLGSNCLPPNDSTVHTLNVCVVVYMYLYYIHVHCSQQPEIVSLPWTVDIGELWHCSCCCLMWFSVCTVNLC